MASTTMEITQSLSAPLSVLLGEMLKTDPIQQHIHAQLAAKMNVFFEKIVGKYEGAKLSELEEMFDACKILPQTVKGFKPAKSTGKGTSKAPKSKAPKPDDADIPTCQAVLGPRSNRQGEMCGKKCKAGMTLCGTHANSKAANTNKSKPVPKAKGGKRKTEFVVPKRDKKTTPVEDSEEVAVKKNKFGNHQDPETLFVFRPPVEGEPTTVFGKQNPKTGDFMEMTEEDKIYIQNQEWVLELQEDEVMDGADTDVDPEEGEISE